MKILLSICGSISAYKSLDLARGLINNGHVIRIILTKGALEFVVPKVYSYLGVEEVYLSEDDFLHKNVLHVELAHWCDVLVIAPLSANTLSRLARGEASDLLSSVFLAFNPKKPILIFPAMNTYMLTHPFTEENFKEIKKLKSLNNLFISKTNFGILACNELGLGKLPNVDEIIELIPSLTPPFMNPSKKIVISTGATISPLDPVRYLTNSSSGITGFHLATYALKKGFGVTVIAGRNATSKLDLLEKHPFYKLIRINTVSEMHDAVHFEIKDANAYLSAAAISDLEFGPSTQKIKKETIETSIKIKKTVDILKTVIERKKTELLNLSIVGFAAETDLSDDVLMKKFTSKPVDLLVGTKVDNGLLVGSNLQGFNVDEAHYRFVENGSITLDQSIQKSQLAEEIFKRIHL